MTKKKEYSFWIGIWKTAKNSVFLLAPFGIAILAGLPAEYAWVTGPLTYFIKNYLENRK
jgi:hypothetical protein